MIWSPRSRLKQNTKYYPTPRFLYSLLTRPHPRGTTHLFYLVPSRTITYYSGRTVRYF